MFPDLFIITGAGRGIGKAIALDLAMNNSFIICISKTSTADDTVKEIVSAGGKAESLVIDIADYRKVEEVLSHKIKNINYRKIGLVLAAGLLGPTGPVVNIDLSEWDYCHKVNVLGNIAVIKASLPSMLQEKFGKIITFAGGGAAYANPTFPAYSATKTSIVRITENIHEDLKDKGDFSIVCLGPGSIETDMLDQYKDSGGNVKSITQMSEPVAFVRSFMESKICSFSGRYVHVKNDWDQYLNIEKSLDDSFWKLRRME